MPVHDDLGNRMKVDKMSSMISPHIIFYEHNGSLDSEIEMSELGLRGIHGMMTRCILKDGSVHVGYADVYGCCDRAHYNGKVHDRIFLETFAHLNEETGELEGSEEEKYDIMVEPIDIKDICKVEAIKYSGPRWGGILTNRFSLYTQQRGI